MSQADVDIFLWAAVEILLKESLENRDFTWLVGWLAGWLVV